MGNEASDLYTFTLRKTACIYKGQAEKGVPHGHGCMECPDGRMYQGEWANGNFNGVGRYNWDKGSYEGDFVGGVMSGSGQMFFQRDSERCLSSGAFTNGGRNGLHIEICVPEALFQDDYQLLQLHRERNIVTPNPKIRLFEGHIKENLYDGFSQVWTDGKHIRGKYDSGLMDGPVHITERDGRQLLLTYNRGQLAGKQFIQMPNSKPISYIWLDNKQHGGINHEENAWFFEKFEELYEENSGEFALGKDNS